MAFSNKSYFPHSALTGIICFLLVAIIFPEFTLKGQVVRAGIITIEGEVLKPQKLTMDDLKKFRQLEITAKDHGGKVRLFKGVPLVDLLETAGVTLGSQLRGKNLLKYVQVEATDKYQVIFSLPEIDPEFTSQTILLAYEVDGLPLEKGDGPYRVVVPNDRKHARWIREVASIKVMSSNE